MSPPASAPRASFSDGLVRDATHGWLCRSLLAGCLLVTGLLGGVAISSAQSVKLSDGLGFSDVVRFAMSPGGTRVAYVHDATVDGAFELYGVPATGGEPVLLSAVLPAGSEVAKVEFANDDRVVYLADQDVAGRDELYSVAAGGGASVDLNPALASDADVHWFGVSVCPGVSWVVFSIVQPAEPPRLYSVPTSGGLAVFLDWTISGYITSDCTRVVYLAATNVKSKPITGGPAIQLNPIGTVVTGFEPTPAGQRVVFRTSYGLYSVPIGGGPAVNLSGSLVEGGGVESYRIDSTSTWVVYRADQDTDEKIELYSVPVTGGDVHRLNASLVAGGDVLDFAISPDGSRVVYRADQQTDGVEELYSVPIGDGTVVKLNGSLVAGGDVFDFQISPDSQWVVYRADQDLNDLPTGYRVPVAGPSTLHELIWLRPFTLDASSYRIDSQSRHVIVRGNFGMVDGVQRLWQVNLAGTPLPNGTELVPVSAFASGGDVTEFELAANGNIVYLADQDTDEVVELYGIPLVFLDGFETGDLSTWSSSSP